MAKVSKEASSRGRQERERGSSAPAGDALVFLVDDDEAVRDAVATSLRGAGFAVASFGSARQFLQAYRAGQRGCLIIDLDMPGVQPELLRLLVAAELALPVIITSRRLRRDALGPILGACAATLLEKPFGVDDLLPLVNAAIAAGCDRNRSGVRGSRT